MSKVLCEKSDLIAIADSVRNKTGTTGGMKVSEIPQKIEAIETGSNINLQEKLLLLPLMVSPLSLRTPAMMR